jgi:hypothetical protein
MVPTCLNNHPLTRNELERWPNWPLFVQEHKVVRILTTIDLPQVIGPGGFDLVQTLIPSRRRKVKLDLAQMMLNEECHTAVRTLKAKLRAPPGTQNIGYHQRRFLLAVKNPAFGLCPHQLQKVLEFTTLNEIMERFNVLRPVNKVWSGLLKTTARISTTIELVGI